MHSLSKLVNASLSGIVNGIAAKTTANQSSENSDDFGHIREVAKSNSMDDDWVVLREEEGDDFLYDHGPPGLTKKDLEHQKWLGKQEYTQFGQFIVIELGPTRTIQKFMLTEVPRNSKVLVRVSKRQPYTRNIWLKDLDKEAMELYISETFAPRNHKAIASALSWLDILRLGLAGEQLEDKPMLETAIFALRHKAKKHDHKLQHMFDSKDLDYIYGKTQAGSPLRTALLDIAIRVYYLMFSPNGPIAFLEELKARFEDKEDEARSLWTSHADHIAVRIGKKLEALLREAEADKDCEVVENELLNLSLGSIAELGTGRGKEPVAAKPQDHESKSPISPETVSGRTDQRAEEPAQPASGPPRYTWRQPIPTVPSSSSPIPTPNRSQPIPIPPSSSPAATPNRTHAPQRRRSTRTPSSNGGPSARGPNRRVASASDTQRTREHPERQPQGPPSASDILKGKARNFIR